MYDRQRGRQQIIEDKSEEVAAITQTIADVLIDNECSLFGGMFATELQSFEDGMLNDFTDLR
jgi:hypothetical protein